MNNTQTGLDEKEKLRRKALSSQNPIDYYTLCEALGLKDVEDEDLYELGEIESQEQRKKESQLEKKINHTLREKEFLKRAQELDIGDFYECSGGKAFLLELYFPDRFGIKGKQNIENYSDAQIGYIFKEVYKSYYKKHS